MQRLLDSKRQKHRQSLAKAQRDQLLKMKRINGDYQQHPLLVLPGLIQRGDWRMIEEALDEITFADKGIGKEMDCGFVVKEWKKALDKDIERVLFKVVNRLGLWEGDWLEQAVERWEQDETMVKEIALLLGEKEEAKDIRGLEILQEKVIGKMLKKGCQLNQQLYYLQIFLTIGQKLDLQQRKMLVPFVDQCLLSEIYTCQLMALEFLIKYQYSPQECFLIMSMQNFKKIPLWALQQDYSKSSQSFQILINLLVSDDTLIQTLISNYNILQILVKFLKHIFPGQRRLAYWGFSNISASEHFVHESLKLIDTLINNYPLEEYREKLEILYCFVNVLYMADQIQLQQVRLNHQKVLEYVQDALESQHVELTIKCLESIYNAISKSKNIQRNMQQYGLTNKLQELERHPNKYISELSTHLLDHSHDPQH